MELTAVLASKSLPCGGLGVEQASAPRAPAHAFPNVLSRFGNGKAPVAAGTASWKGPGRGEPLLRIRKTPPRLEAESNYRICKRGQSLVVRAINEGPEVWNESEIEKRSESLHSAAVQVWPYWTDL